MTYFVINESPRVGVAPWINPAVASLSANLGEHSVKVVDLNFLDEKQLADQMKRDAPLAICFSCYIDNFGAINHLSRLCKETSPKTKIIIGGPHVTLLGSDSMKISKDVDIAVYGEGEKVLNDLINKITRKKPISSIGGISYIEKDRIVTNEGQNLIEDLDHLPIPNLRFFDLDRYFPLMVIETSRGCPYCCPFCAYPKLYGRRLRTKSVSRVLEELGFHLANYGIRYFRFVDATFTNPPTRFEQICKAIINSGIKIKWCCFARFDNMTENTIKLAKAAGCVAMFIGIESGDHSILKKMHKDQDFHHTKKMVRLAKKIGIHIHGNFILGFPTENSNSIENTVHLIRYLKLDSVTINPLYLVPQSDLHIKAKKWGVQFIMDNWPIHLHECFRDSALEYFKHSTMTQMDIRKGVDKVKNELEEEDIFWDMKDYIVTAWLSLGGNISDLRKVWRNPSDYLTSKETRYFQAFRERGRMASNEIETSKMKEVLTSIAQRQLER